MARDIIRVTVAVRVDEGKDPKKVAQEFREANVGGKIQQTLANISGPSAVAGLEMETLDDEHLTHQCEWYEQDECEICRFASSYSLARTQARYF